MNQAIVVVLGVIAFMLAAVVIIGAIGLAGFYLEPPKSDPPPAGYRPISSCFLAEELAARGPVQRQTQSTWQRELKQLRSQCEDETKRGTPPPPTPTR
jgi:hypothetical protein